MKNFLLLFLSFFMLKSFGQNSIEVPMAFKEIILPRAWSDEWNKLNSSNNEFQVSNTDGKLEVSKYNGSETCEIKTPDGKIIGIDVGEWGGKLFFVPTESAKKKFYNKGWKYKIYIQLQR